MRGPRAPRCILKPCCFPSRRVGSIFLGALAGIDIRQAFVFSTPRWLIISTIRRAALVLRTLTERRFNLHSVQKTLSKMGYVERRASEAADVEFDKKNIQKLEIASQEIAVGYGSTRRRSTSEPPTARYLGC